MKRNLIAKILVAIGGILSIVSMFLPIGVADNSKYGLNPSYVSPLSESDPSLSGWVVGVSIVLIAICIAGLFVKSGGWMMFSKVFGILGSLFLGGISVLAVFYVENLKNLAGDKPSLYVGIWLLIIGAILVFFGSVLAKSKGNDHN